MAITYSPDQLEIINSRDENILVAAAAGSGKTAVLVERIIQQIMNPYIGRDGKEHPPLDIDRILVVTFTSAAAAEMKERIMKAIEDRLIAETDNQRLQKQSALVHNAHIMTIDSFCLDVVKNNFHKIGVDPSYRVAANGEAELLKKDAMATIMEAAYEKGDPEFFNLIDCYVTKDKDTSIEENIDKLYSFAMSYPEPEKWLIRQKEEYFYDTKEEFLASSLVKKVCAAIADKLKMWTGNFEKMMEMAKAPDGPSMYIPNIQDYMDMNAKMLDYLEAGKLVEFSKYAYELEFPRLSLKRDACDPDLKARVKAYRENYKQVFGDIRAKNLILDPEYEMESLRLAGRVVSVLTELTIAYKNEFERLKKNRGIIDFSDMEHYALAILLESFEDVNNYTVTDVARDYQNRFDEVMIDEYQDSNLVQEILLAAVSHQGTEMLPNRFMVGDVKQSIYRFRLARPEIFVDKKREYETAGVGSRVINLKQNFRSRKEVLDSVNKVFYSIMQPEYGGIEYNDDEALYLGADYADSPSINTTELVLLDCRGRRVKYVRADEADAVCYLIKKLVGSHMVYDKDKKALRPATYRDIAVLAAKPSAIRDIISQAFDRYAIPYHMENVGTFYKAHEIQDVLNVLRILDNPLNDIPLYGAMTSFFGGFSPETCAVIRGEGQENEYYLWEKLCGYIQRHSEDETARKFVSFVEKYRKLSIYTPIGELVTKLVTESGYLLYVSAGTDGRQKEANVELLIKKASDYSKTSFSGIFHFLRFVELFEKIGLDEGEAGIFDENSDTVRIMSIHKSKGLEFPICIVTAMDDVFNNREKSTEFVLDIDSGIGARAIDAEARTRRSNIKRELIVSKIDEAALGERIRLLYVAMTRAKEKLIMLGAPKKPADFFDESDALKPTCFLNLVANPVKYNDFDKFKVVELDPDRLEVQEVIRVITKKEARAELEETEADNELAEKIQKAVSFDYPHKNLSGLKIKTTVSELKMAAMEEVQGETEALFKEREKEEYVPRFAGGQEKVGGTDRGTAYHNVLQLIDFSLETTEEGWKQQLEQVVSAGKLTREEVELVNKKRLFSFAGSDMAKRMHLAAKRGELFKEQPFVMGVSADRLNNEYPDSETVLVQGVIDVFFYEDDKVVVMDYKTDKVDNAAELAQRYQKQLDIYGEALEKLTGKQVKEKTLYSFALGEEIVLK